MIEESLIKNKNLMVMGMLNKNYKKLKILSIFRNISCSKSNSSPNNKINKKEKKKFEILSTYINYFFLRQKMMLRYCHLFFVTNSTQLMPQLELELLSVKNKFFKINFIRE